jgi:hypothetical protein
VHQPLALVERLCGGVDLLSCRKHIGLLSRPSGDVGRVRRVTGTKCGLDVMAPLRPQGIDRRAFPQRGVQEGSTGPRYWNTQERLPTNTAL